MTACRVAMVGLVLGLALLWPDPAAPHNPVTTTVLFNREIAALFSQKCLQCHATGKLAMPLETFEQARPWAQAIKEEVLARKMPPWPAQKGFGNFANDISLTPRELDFLISWVDGGTPEGTDPPPAHADHSAHWMLGPPDRTVSPPRGVIIERGVAPQIRRFIIDLGVRQGVWLSGFDYKPGDARVARAAFISVMGSDQFIGGWTPWAPSMQFAGGGAIRLPRGSQLAVDVLYQPTSSTVTDRPSLGLYFAERPAREIRTLTIAPNATTVAVAQDVELLSVRMQSSAAARSLELRAKRPDGGITPLLRIRQLRHDWPTPYVFAKPVRLARGTTVQAIVRYADEAPAAERNLTVSINSQPAGR